MRHDCYLLFNKINRGIQRIITAAYFSATKTGNLLCCKQI